MHSFVQRVIVFVEHPFSLFCMRMNMNLARGRFEPKLIIILLIESNYCHPCRVNDPTPATTQLLHAPSMPHYYVRILIIVFYDTMALSIMHKYYYLHFPFLCNEIIFNCITLISTIDFKPCVLRASMQGGGNTRR